MRNWFFVAKAVIVCLPPSVFTFIFPEMDEIKSFALKDKKEGINE